MIERPGFNRGLEIPELVGQVDLLPSLLTAAGLPAPPGVQGRRFLPLLERRVDGWRNEVYFEISEFVTGRGLRTPRYTYSAMAPKEHDWRSAPRAPGYVEYMMYDNYVDPAQHVNVAGRAPMAKRRNSSALAWPPEWRKMAEIRGRSNRAGSRILEQA